MALSLVVLFHKLNRFLGTPAGELFKRASELILLVFASYMVASEWLKTRSTQLKYLLVGFGSLAAEKLIATLFLARAVFLDDDLLLPAVDAGTGVLEIFALVLVGAAFLYPLLPRKKRAFRAMVTVALAAVLVPVAGAFLFLFTLPAPALRWSGSGAALLEFIKLAVLWLPAILLWLHREQRRYSRNAATAFMVYSITPLVDFVNLAAFAGTHADLRVLAHPFPFLAVALFTRVLFLKLVDKATLTQELVATRQQYVREREVSSLKDEFVSTVSHELRTPLTSIRLYLKLLLQGSFGKLRKRQQKTVQVLDGESARLGKLIDDILDLSKLEQRKETLSCRKTGIFGLVESSIYPVLSEQKRIHVRNMIPRDLEVMADPDKFRQVIVNLFSNAVKHTPEGGRITFTAERSGRRVLLSVSDTGSGIDPKAVPYIFDKFYQAENHLVRTGGGLGLGLAIAKYIVGLHGGTISVRSAPGEGATFTIELPDRITASEEHEKAVAKQAAGG